MNTRSGRTSSVLAAALLFAGTTAGEPAGEPIVLFADVDDDDDDGRPDLAASKITGRTAADLWPTEGAPPLAGRVTRIEGDAVRGVVRGAVLPSGPFRPVAARDLRLQGRFAGRASLEIDGERRPVVVIEATAFDARGSLVDLATSHASITRTLPIGLEPDAQRDDDGDALRWMLRGPAGAVPERVAVESTRPGGRPLDRLDAVPLAPAACPSGTPKDVECRATPLLRATSDEIDRSHPDSLVRSLRAEVGGRIGILVEGREAASIRVGGPRRSALGPIDRYRARVRMLVVRLSPGGSVPVGGNDAGAIAVARAEARVTSALWGQCGIHFGLDEDLEVRVVDPPPPHLLAVGCNVGLPSSGGEIAFTVENEPLHVKVPPGRTPIQVAADVARAIRASGHVAAVSANAATELASLRTADVIVRKKSGELVRLGAIEGTPVSTDPTLGACIGAVDLSDGLEHFTDFDASAGTLEERTLVKAFDDGDATTIEVFLVASFAKTGRIGESFIHADGASIENAVILDRAGVRAGARSYALAHELGHVLLDMPGHPDDYGVDQPSMLMDADAADPTIFGPRRLSVGECERVLRQNGPGAPVPLLERWPLFGN